jgi:hypothetical protein
VKAHLLQGGLELGPVVAQASALSPELLARVAAELLDQFRDAVLAGDKDRLDQLIQRVGEYDAELAAGLEGLADRYEYDALTRGLEETQSASELR